MAENIITATRFIEQGRKSGKHHPSGFYLILKLIFETRRSSRSGSRNGSRFFGFEVRNGSFYHSLSWHFYLLLFSCRTMEDFVTWVNTSAIKKKVLDYNDMVSNAFGILIFFLTISSHFSRLFSSEG
jgi:hypothetical protein